MADTTTTTYSLTKPEIGASEDSWGTKLNNNLDSIDDLLDGTTAVTGIDINSGSIDGTAIGASTAAAGTFTTLASDSLTVDTNTLVVDATNNRVGVGIASPTYNFVVSNAGASGIEFGPGYSGTNNLIQHYNRSGSAYVIAVNDAAEHRFNISGSEKMRIDSDGDVGIGETSPAARLHISNDQGGGAGRVLIDANVSSGYETRIDVTDTGYEFTSKSNSRPILFKLGSTPVEKFRMEYDGDFHADGDVIAYSTTVSDERLKDDIKVVEGALEKVNQLKGVTFKYKTDGKVSAGVIAQDVEKVLPEAVTEKEIPLKQNDGEAYKTVRYDALHALLIEAIKELSDEVAKLKGNK